MKKILLVVGIFLCTHITYSQETTKNAENSSYVFTKIAHLDATPVQSQGNTGTCWSFSALSFFESELIRKGNKNPDALSEMYVVRKAYEAKAEKFVRVDGKGNFSEGGAFHDIPYVIKKYGIVPKEVYKGLNYGSENHDHSEMYALLNGAVEGLMKHIKEIEGEGISNVWKKALAGVLDAYLGKDPQEFDFKGKKYTPKSYAESLKLNMDDYISLTSFTNHDKYSLCYLEIPDNWSWGTSYNVELQDLMTTVESALKKGYTIAWGADVSEKGFSFRNGLAIVPEDLSTIQVAGRDNRNFSNAGADKNSNAFLTPTKEINVTPELRQEAYDNKSTTDDHGMHITGLYKDQNGTRYLLVKNSWGTGNYPAGYLYVSENYFNLKTINIYLHKDGIPSDLRKKIKV
jgi:bleomycin hydrolase